MAEGMEVMGVVQVALDLEEVVHQTVMGHRLLEVETKALVEMKVILLAALGISAEVAEEVDLHLVVMAVMQRKRAMYGIACFNFLRRDKYT